MLDLPQAELSDWLACLKPYQTKQITALLTHQDPVSVAKTWVSANGAAGVQGFGHGNEADPFFQRLQVEIKKLICGHPDYREVRNKLLTENKIAYGVFVSTISTALSATLGVAAGLLAPAVALLLYAATKVSLQTYCADFEPS